MKRLSVLLFLQLALLACSTPDFPDDEPPSKEPPESDHLDLGSVIPWDIFRMPRENDETETAEQAPVSDWLRQRQKTCSQHPKTIEAQLQQHRKNFRADAQSPEPALAHSQLQALMLASCNPARTPGLFNDFLGQMTESTQWSEEYQALFELMASQQRAYANLERRFAELEALHQKTIEGIGNIERFLESQIEQE